MMVSFVKLLLVNTNEPNHVKLATKVGDDHLGITSLDKEGEASLKNGVPGTPNTDLHDATVIVDETQTRFRELHLVLTMNPSSVIRINVEYYELLLQGIIHAINGIVSAYKSEKKISEVKEVKGFKSAALHGWYYMVFVTTIGEEYDKVFNHLDMLNAPLEGKGFITTAKFEDVQDVQVLKFKTKLIIQKRKIAED
ncbi:hypothetical protein Tco_0953014 [Tanacetum coccineum]|uniref:Uncharacterized protein n=1 Tax=Tanacetum coccineum TaxID=301880 RepID=A0ABQ5DZL3_9ASTR